MTIEDLKHKKIAIYGLGIEGLATAKYLHAHNLSFTVLDEKTIAENHRHKFQELGITYKIGKEAFSAFSKFDVLFRSPGVPILRKELQDFKQQGGIITSATQFFLENCPCPVIGVTGTKGKGTTCSLIYEMLKVQGKDAYLGGNIGKAQLEFLDTVNDQSIVVLEMSSFQLQDITISPHIAVVLMITSEHLDYHKDVEEYIDAKRNIVRFQQEGDFAVINRDYPASNESDIYTNGKVFYVSRERETDNGCYALGGRVVVKRNGQEEEIIKTSELVLPGAHNYENVCAAVMAAKLSGVQTKHIVSVLKTFKGLEHRLELVREVEGVAYYDDSFSTTPETTIAAIDAFINPKILVLGGSSKNSDFSELGKIIRSNESIKAIIGIGDEWLRIKNAIGTATHDMLLIEGAKNMEQIIKAAKTLAKPGDVVLLSPACASFGMFQNYKDRGEQFKNEVNKIVSQSRI